MIRILLLSRYSPLGASSRLRFFQYIPYLESNGVHIKVCYLLGDDYLNQIYSVRKRNISPIIRAYLGRLRCLIKSRSYDLLWIEKELFPFLPALSETLLSMLDIPYVVDYDDATFHTYDLHTNLLVRTLLRNKIGTIMRRAAVVIVGNDYLAVHAYKAGAKSVEFLPTVIDLARYPLSIPGKNKVFSIGWIGTGMTAKYLASVQSALAQVCKGNKAELIVIGTENVKLKGVPTKFRHWSETTEVSEIQNFDVGIMPLWDKPWEQGKCGYKLIQYMACCRAVIASPIGANARIVDHGISGYLVSSQEDWIYAMNTLRENYELIVNMGKAGREKIEKQYCLQKTAPKLLVILHNAARRAS